MDRAMANWVAYFFVFCTIALTVYGQFIVKWQVLRAGAFPGAPGARLGFILQLLLNPWIISAFAAAFVASITWMLALTKLPLSHAYPMMALTFVLVVLGSTIVFREPLSVLRMAGLLLIVAGIVVGSRG
jgi:multidrug transporter EmrE-like cation transporter